MPKGADGKRDHTTALTGDDLRFRTQTEKHELRSALSPRPHTGARPGVAAATRTVLAALKKFRLHRAFSGAL